MRQGIHSHARNRVEGICFVQRSCKQSMACPRCTSWPEIDIPDRLWVNADELVERFPHVWRAALGGGIALRYMLARLFCIRIDAGKANNGTSIWEVAYIADLCYKLGGGDFPNAVHGQNSVILRKI